MLSVAFYLLFAEFCYAECRYAECRNALYSVPVWGRFEVLLANIELVRKKFAALKRSSLSCLVVSDDEKSFVS
jgi:hypothetical protein